MDPLLSDGVGLAEVLIVLLKCVSAFTLLLVGVILAIWFERKIISDMQNRIGPNQAGPWGILQTLADGVKLIFKEDLIPNRADRFVFQLAPFLSVIPAFVTFAVVPIAGNFSGDNRGIVSIFGHETVAQVADPPIGVLLVLAMSSLAVYGVMLAGWSSGSKYPLLGAVRASAQMVSYEAALSLSVLAVVLISRSLSTNAIVGTQDSLAELNLVMTGFVPFVIFLIAGTAELNRPPFDLVEAEQELVGGFQTEYSSIRFGLFYLSEFMNTITMSAIIVTLFLGGPNGPSLGLEGTGPLQDWFLPMLWFFLKLMVFMFMFVWFRGTLPRFRYDQLMDLGWKVLIPLSLGWFIVLAAIRQMDTHNWNPVVVLICCMGGLLLGFVLLSLAVRTSRERRMLEEVDT